MTLLGLHMMHLCAIALQVSVKVLGGLMALGYEIGALMKRKSVSYSDADITIKFDAIDKLGSFVQIQGKDRNKVAEAGKALGLDGTYLATSYIEQVLSSNCLSSSV